MPTKRFCLFCHQVGMTVEFTNGNQLRRHVRERHPRTPKQVARDRVKLRVYRKELLLLQAKLHRTK